MYYSIAIIELSKYANQKGSEKIRAKALHEAGNSVDIAFKVSKYETAEKADQKVQAYKVSYSGAAAITKKALLSLIPGLFALLLAFFTLINSETLNEVSELNFQNVFALFSLGAGIESIKGLFDRISV